MAYQQKLVSLEALVEEGKVKYSSMESLLENLKSRF